MKILQPIKNILDRINESIFGTLAKKFRAQEDVLRQRLFNLLVSAYKLTDEYESLISGQLTAEFGLFPNDAERIDRIIEEFCKDIRFTFQYPNIYIYFVKVDYDKLISMPEAYTGIPWLEYFLLRGDEIVVPKYQILYGNFPYRSRSGQAIMVEYGSWRVPPKFSGTAGNNWITRTLEIFQKDIENELINILRKL